MWRRFRITNKSFNTFTALYTISEWRKYWKNNNQNTTFNILDCPEVCRSMQSLPSMGNQSKMELSSLPRVLSARYIIGILKIFTYFMIFSLYAYVLEEEFIKCHKRTIHNLYKFHKFSLMKCVKLTEKQYSVNLEYS